MSRSLRARGLKWACEGNFLRLVKSRSLRARGLKCDFIAILNYPDQRRALYGRVDWNNPIIASYITAFTSRSLRARGLKYRTCRTKSTCCRVALFTGAWIEIVCARNRGRLTRCRALYGRVDWNQSATSNIILISVALFTGAWIEILITSGCSWCSVVALFTGAWIEINKSFAVFISIKVALFTGAWIEIRIITRKY